MKRALIILLVLSIILFGCAQQAPPAGQVQQQQPAQQVQQQQAGQNATVQETAEQTKPADEGSDCMILSESDVKSVCGDVTFGTDRPISSTEVCRNYFRGTKAVNQLLVITYIQTGSLTPTDMVSRCMTLHGDAKSVGSSKGCLYGSGNFFEFAGKKYLVKLANTNSNNIVCTPDQMEKLADKLSGKLY